MDILPRTDQKGKRNEKVQGFLCECVWVFVIKKDRYKDDQEDLVKLTFFYYACGEYAIHKTATAQNNTSRIL